MSEQNKHRGAVLPYDMTPELADALASLFNDFADDQLDAEAAGCGLDDNVNVALYAAIKAFLLVKKGLNEDPRDDAELDKAWMAQQKATWRKRWGSEPGC